VHAKPPRHVPRWLARLVAGDVGVVLMTEVRGASNAKARRELGWAPAHSSWRDGFREVVAGSGTHEARSPRAIRANGEPAREHAL
jgi:hypothetical protein